MNFRMQFGSILAMSFCFVLNFKSYGESAQKSLPYQKMRIQTNGKPFGLKFETDSTVSFCDNRGGQKFNLVTGSVSQLLRQCLSDDEANGDCSNSSFEIVVRRPGLGPVDIVDVGGYSYVIDPHVEDCAVDGKSISIASPASVIRINSPMGISYEVDSKGGRRIVTRRGWSVWSTDSEIHSSFEWNLYLLPKLGIRGCYPSDIFWETPASISNDTGKMVYADGATLHVFGTDLHKKINLKDEYLSVLKVSNQANEIISYKVFKGDWFVVSGTNGKNIFYRKTRLSDKSLSTIDFTYDTTKRKIYDHLVKQLVGCFGDIPLQ